MEQLNNAGGGSSRNATTKVTAPQECGVGSGEGGLPQEDPRGAREALERGGWPAGASGSPPAKG